MSNKIIFVAVFLILFTLSSCGINDCGCNSVSLLNGRWEGVYFSESFSLEMIINLAEKNSNVSGSGICSLFSGNHSQEIPITVVGSFVSNRLVFSLTEMDSVGFDGYLDSTNNKITGNLLYKQSLLPFVFQRLK